MVTRVQSLRFITMPSEAAKKRQQQKKERRIALEKKRIAEQKTKGKIEVVSNGVNTVPEGGKSTDDGATPLAVPSSHCIVKTGATPTVASVSTGFKDVKISSRSCTGVLTSHPSARDIHIGSLSITLHGAELLCDAKLELNCGRRYGLVGLNGSGTLYIPYTVYCVYFSFFR